MRTSEPCRGDGLFPGLAAPVGAWLLAWFLGSALAAAQPPNLGEGRMLWHGEVEGHQLRLWQIPRSGSALIPRRFLLEESGGPPGRSPLLEKLAGVEISAVAGIEATRAYTPVRLPLHLWGDRLAEVRETFRAPGTYSLRFLHDDGRVVVQSPVEVAPYAYLSFGTEMGIFVMGCLALGIVMLLIIRSLHRRRLTPLPSRSVRSPA